MYLYIQRDRWASTADVFLTSEEAIQHFKAMLERYRKDFDNQYPHGRNNYEEKYDENSGIMSFLIWNSYSSVSASMVEFTGNTSLTIH